MSAILLVIKFWKEVLIFFLLLVCAFFLYLSTVYIYKYENAELKCKQQVNQLKREYSILKEKADKQAYSAGELYESKKTTLKEKQNVVHKTIEKIIERPIYLNVCLDDDGLSEINSSIKAYNP